MNDEEGKLETQCWICPICKDDHRQPDSYFSYCKLEDLQQMRDIGVEQQRAVNDRQYKEKLELKKSLEKCKALAEEMLSVPLIEIKGLDLVKLSVHVKQNYELKARQIVSTSSSCEET